MNNIPFSSHPEKSSSEIVMDPFEGVEKRLLIVFQKYVFEGTPAEKAVERALRPSLRSFPRQLWETCVLNPIGCKILSEIKHPEGDFDGYLLSESSLFIYNDAMLIKTCGLTKLSLAPIYILKIFRQMRSYSEFEVNQIIEQATDLDLEIEAGKSDDLLYHNCAEFFSMLNFSHLTYEHPNLQCDSHRCFENELKILNPILPVTSSIELKGTNSRSFYLFCAKSSESLCISSMPIAPLYSLEFSMFCIHPDSVQRFVGHFQQGPTLEGAPLHITNGKDQSFYPKISELDHEGLNEFFFEPQGYSCNIAINPAVFCTVHITPEEEMSYASVESTSTAEVTTCDDISLTVCEEALRNFAPREFHLVSIGFQGYKHSQHIILRNFLLCKNPCYKIASVETSVISDFSVLYSVVVLDTQGEPPGDLLHVKKINVEPMIYLSSFSRDTQTIRNLVQRTEPARATHLMDLKWPISQLRLWKVLLPNIAPLYAVKCNSNIGLLQLLAQLGCGFDCASVEEIETMLKMNVPADRIVYSNPCKAPSQMQLAHGLNISLSVFDNEVEIEKSASLMPSCAQLLRIRVDDCGSQCPMSGKFGAPATTWRGLLEKAIELHVSVIGVHFHVGSGCKKPGAFKAAINQAKEVFKLASSLGLAFTTLNIGGGFPGNPMDALLLNMSEEIKSALDCQTFREVKTVAEPGRYFAAASSMLVVEVISFRRPTKGCGVKAAGPSTPPIFTHTDQQKCDIANDAIDESFLYYVNDSVYGTFNCLVFDHASLYQPIVIKRKASTATDPHRFRSIIFGQTCDGFDTICTCWLPILDATDWIVFRDVGAYTLSAASCFNGFSPADVTYYF